MSFVKGFAAGTVLLGLSLAVTFPTPDTYVRDLSQPIPPSQDVFYTAPAGFESTAPGTVLRVRSTPGNLTSSFNASSSAYNILYRTTDSRYQPSWAVTTLFVPFSPVNSTSGALLSYQIPYNTADADASPSYLLSSEFASGLILTDINAALGNGWYVNVPDFEGPLASFTSGVEEGHAVVDSVRAVLSSNLGLSSDARYALWGYSGGSIASEFAAELQVQYAPELNFSGMALGGLVPNLTSIVYNVDGTSAGAGLIPSALLGLTSQHPAAYEYLVSQLKSTGLYNTTGFLAARNMSYVEASQAYAGQQILQDYFTAGDEILNQPVIQKALDSDTLMGYHGVPQMPIFAYKAVHDEYSHVDETDALVTRYCFVGANILYQRNTVGNHIDEETNGDARALAWLQAVLDGTYGASYPIEGCTIQNVAVNITSHGPFAPQS